MKRSGKKYLVVGANGFLGAAIVQRLNDEHAVTAVYHSRRDRLAEGIPAVPAEKLEELPDDFDAVFLTGAYIPPKGAEINKALLEDANVKLPLRVVTKFRNARIVFASSVSVYMPQQEPITEHTAPRPESAYGKSKLAAEAIIAKHPDHAIIRIASMYGPGMNEETFLPQVAAAALSSGKIRLYGDGSRLQNYIHVKDVAEFFLRAASDHSNNTYLAVAKRSCSNMEIAGIIRGILGEDVSMELEGKDHSPSYVYDASFSYKALEAEPEVSIEEGLAELIKWKQKKS
jgi:UDP-glucose 4-epimerase